MIDTENDECPNVECVAGRVPILERGELVTGKCQELVHMTKRELREYYALQRIENW